MASERSCTPRSVKANRKINSTINLVCGWSGKILYVGSTTVGVRTRFSQHLESLTKTLDWASVYIIPLRDGTSEKGLRRVEGRIGLAVGPERNKALPRIAVGS
jgi:hypothetical protein